MADVRVLVVDDAAIVRDRITELLSEAGGLTVVGAARDGNEALALATSLKPDVVLLDLHLPDISGFVVLRELRRGHPDLPVVVFTTDPSPFHRDRCFALGADAFLDKSQDIERVADVTRALGTR